MVLGVDESIEAGYDQGITAETWNALIEEYNNAKALLEDVDAADAETLEQQIAAFEEAVANLVSAGDGSALAGLVETAKNEDLSKYTEESAEAIRQAIAKAEEALKSAARRRK